LTPQTSPSNADEAAPATPTPPAAQIRFNADFWRSAVDCDALRDDQWERLKDFVPGGRKGKRGPRSDNRRFLNTLLWMARSGARWRDLPDEFGDYEAVKRRYYRWIERGVLDEVLAALSREADLEWLMIDSTIVRAHQHAAGASRQKGGRMASSTGSNSSGASQPDTTNCSPTSWASSNSPLSPSGSVKMSPRPSPRGR
jgi:transposase